LKLVISKSAISDWIQMKWELNVMLAIVHHLSSYDLYLKKEDIKHNVSLVSLP